MRRTRACLVATVVSVATCCLGLAPLTTARAAAAWEHGMEDGGVRADVRLRGLGGAPLRQGAPAHLEIRLSSALDGRPLAATVPGVWLDAGGANAAGGAVDGDAGADACQRRIARYVRASGVAPQALLELNGYDVLALNVDPSISVLDPRTQLAGRTSLRAALPLPGPGFDWAATADDARLFVSIPTTSSVAVLDLVAMRPGTVLSLPGSPGRVRLHPDGGRVWVGVPGSPGGVAVVGAEPPYAIHWIPLGPGHIDMAFDPAGWVAVTQRAAGNVSFVDPTTLSVIVTAALGEGAQPVSVAFDARARRFLVAEARHGRLHAFDHRGQQLAPLELRTGIGPMSITVDGRWLLVANPTMHEVAIVDLVGWRVAHRVPVSGRPFDIVQTSAYAYVRSLDSEAVTLVALASLSASPRVQHIAIGERAPGRTPNLPLATQMVPMVDGTGAFVVSPGDNAVYYYMEGMNAAAGSVSARGKEARAVRLAKRGLRQTAPGIYETQVTLPRTSRLVLAVATDVPRTRLCASFELADAETAATSAWQLSWETMPTLARLPLGFRIDGIEPAALPPQVQLKLFRPGGGHVTVEALGDGTGRFHIVLPDLLPGIWFAHPQAPSAAGAAKWGYVSFQREDR
jgi:DNA-binding beta-propeller fold protein YncE